MTETYSTAFYDGQIDGSRRSARLLLAKLFEHYRPASVVDFGCGRGAWLSTALDLGATRAVGYDGQWVEREFVDPRIEFSNVDLSSRFNVNDQFDLAISIEVAEHLPSARASTFVDLLCNSSNVVIFGAASKFQGGTYHINEQWASYWLDLFQRRGYLCIDLFRQEFWGNSSVEWWYQQNTFLFVREHTVHKLEKLQTRYRPSMLDVVHPDNFSPKVLGYQKMMNTPDLNQCVRLFRQYLLVKLGRSSRVRAPTSLG